MAKRNRSGLEAVAAMPWPVGIVLGVLGYVAIRHGIGWTFGSANDPYLSGLGTSAAAGTYAPLGWLLLAGCWIAAVVSFIGRARRRKLLDGQTGIDSLRRMRWPQFEQLAGEAFRRQGYSVEETGLGGADGGVDLVLRRDGRTTLVQCKQWQNRHVGVAVVREMYGLLMHHRAAAVKIVALVDYTLDARRFAHGKPIELIHGGELIATVRSLQAQGARATRPMDTPFALVGSMLAGLLAIMALSSSTAVPRASDPASVAAQPFRPALRPTRVDAPAPTLQPASLAPSQQSPHAQASIYASDPESDPALREWKKRNAAAMKIMEATTKEMSLR